jgi:hypothetical protein
VGFGSNPIRRRLLPDQGEVDHGPQGVASLTAQL